MSQEFRRDYLIRIPLPLAQLYQRAYNDKSAQSRHNNTFYLFEALIKLTTAPAVAAYLLEVEQGGARVAELDRLLVQLALPSLGQWVGMLRALARHFGTRPDAAAHPLGHLWEQLNRPYRDRPGLLALYQRIKNGVDGEPAGDQSCTLMQVIDALVPYRNAVFGHGAERFASFYEAEMGPLLFPAANEMLAEGMLDILGPRGSRLVHLAELRMLDEDRVEVGLRELVGEHSARTAPLILSRAQAEALVPDRVVVLWPGRPVPLRLDPLLLYREREMGDEVLFLNRDRNGRQVEYLSYTRGEPERDRATAPALAALLGRVTGRTICADQLDALAQQSVAETPSVEALFGPISPPARALGDYEILAEIGRGGMGVVYLARQLSLGRLVALKMLPADLAGDEVALARFRREMRLLARCDHPHIIKVLATGTLPDGRVYYAMEYVPGCDLEQVWRELSGGQRQGDASSLGGSTWTRAVLSASRKKRDQMTPQPATLSDTDPARAEQPLPSLPLPPLPELPSAEDDPGGYARRVAALVRDAALALQAIHDQQVVHRDVKPANLMLTPDGTRVVLMDFGLAKGQSLSLTATKAGGLLGTLRYAAPEQLAAASLKVGPEADVRGLGVTLWELLTRRRLFAEAEDERQLATLVHDRDVPRLRSIDATLDRDLEAIVARATERRAGDRIASAAHLAEYLQLYLDGRSLPIRPPTTAEMVGRWVRTNRALVGSAASAFLAIVSSVVIAFVLITRSRDEAVQSRNNERKGKIESQLRLADLNLERGVNLCNEGKVVHGLLGIVSALKASPDDRSADEQQQLILANLGGWIDQLHPLQGLLTRGEFVTSAVYSPDGKTVLTRGHDQMAWLWEVSSGRPIGAPLSHEAPVILAAFSPDGKTVFTASYDKTARLWEVLNGRPIGPRLVHQEWVYSVAFSPDGKTVLTGSDDKTGRLWDATSGQPIGGPMTHQAPVIAVAYSPDGKTALTGSGNIARLWEAPSGRPIGAPMTHQSRVKSVAFSPDGKTLFTRSNDETAWFWEATSGRPIEAPMTHQGQMQSVAFSPDGKTVLTGSGNTARLWEAPSGQPIGTPLTHQGWIRFVAFSPDGKTLLTASDDNTARLWDGPTGHALGTPLTHQGRIESVAFSPDGKTLLTRSGYMARLWDVPSGQQIGAPLTHRKGVESVTYSPDGKTVLTLGRDGLARLWDAPSGRTISIPMTHHASVTAVAYSPDGKTVLTGSDDKTARLWDTASGQPIGAPMTHQGGVKSVAFSPDGKTVLTGSDDKTARLWDAASGQAIGAPMTHQAQVAAVAYRPDGKTVLTASDKIARLWDTPSGRPIGAPMTLRTRSTFMAFSPDGKTILTQSKDDGPRLWQGLTGQPIHTPKAPPYESVAFSPDGKTVLARDGNSAQLWEASSGWIIGRPMVHQERVNSVAFSPDGKTVLTGSDDHTARLWQARSARPIGAPMTHQEGVTSVAFSPDGKTVLTGSDDHTARFWQASSGRPIGAPMTHESAVSSVAFGPDGESVLTGSGDRTVRLWRVPSMKGGVDRLAVAIEALTGEVFDSQSVVPFMTSPTWSSRRGQIEQLGGVTGLLGSSAERAAAWHESVATESEQKGEWFAATWHLDRMIASRPLDGSLCARRGRARLQLGRSDEALADFDQAISLQPRNGSFYAERGRTRLQLGRSDEALADFDQAISLQPRDGPFYAERGRARLQLGRSNEALSDFNQAIALGGEPSWIWAERGAAHAKLGHWKSAVGDFINAVTLPTVDPVNWYCLALSHLAGGDLTGYRKVCSEAIHQSATIRRSTPDHWLMSMCIAGPNAIDEPSPLVRMLEDPKIRDTINPCLQAASLYRAGRYQECHAMFQVASQTLAPTSSDHLFLAMVLHRLGHVDDARRHLDEATKWIDTQDQTHGGKVWPDWRSCVELHCLRKEAGDLITVPNSH